MPDSRGKKNLSQAAHKSMQQIKYSRAYFIAINKRKRKLRQFSLFLCIFLSIFLQDRHVTRNGDTEPVVDPSQDYMLMLGYENATHTVLRFRRKLDTCDASHDMAITVSTVDILIDILAKVCAK